MDAPAPTPSPTLRPAMLPLEGADATRRVAWLSVLTAVVLSALKLGGWVLSGSIGLLATLADSALDLVAALGTLTAVRMAVTPPDAEHRYGHGKAEAFAALLQSALVLASAVLIGREAVAHLIDPQPVRAQGAALAVTAVSTLMAAGLVAAQNRVLARARSVAVESDRVHYLADVATNIVAFLGLGAAIVLKTPRADAGAGLVISALLAWGALVMAKGARDNLMDRELDADERALIRELLEHDPHVLDVHDLRTRASGPIVHIQAHVTLAPDMTVEAAHHILVRAEGRLLERFPSADILLHPDPDGRAEPHGGAFAEAVREGDAFEPEMTPAAAASTRAS